MLVQYKVRYNGHRTPVISVWDVKVPKGSTELVKKQLIEEFFKNNINQEGILQRYPYEIIKNETKK